MGGCAAEMINLEIFVRPNRGLNPVRRIDDRVSYHSATSLTILQPCFDLISQFIFFVHLTNIVSLQLRLVPFLDLAPSGVRHLPSGMQFLYLFALLRHSILSNAVSKLISSAILLSDHCLSPCFRFMILIVTLAR